MLKKSASVRRLLFGLSGLFSLSGFLVERNEPDEPDQPTKPDGPDEPDKPPWFFRSLLVLSFGTVVSYGLHSRGGWCGS